jgi:outer membrane protein OmpA-like peptidoglycan-associated protein
MRTPLPFLAGLLLVLVCGNAAAQVVVDPGALDQLQAPAKHPNAQAKPAPARPAQRRPAAPKPRASTVVRPSTSAPEPPAPPLVPIAPPPPPVIPQPVAVPVRPAPAPNPPTIAADAPGTAATIPDGLRVTFGADRADLNPDTDAALRALVHNAGTSPGITFTVTAFAAGMPEDPSTPRRLALSRALTVRSVLINEGIASIRIYVRALGAAAPAIADGPADRADIVVGRTPTEASSQTKSTP